MPVKPVLDYPPAALVRTGAPPAPHPLPRPLTALRARECRYCLVDAPPGEMHRALFCAAPTGAGAVYCATHAPRCRLPQPLDLEALAAEVEAALAPRP